MFPEGVYYEPAALSYPLGRQLKQRFAAAPWVPIESHNKIDALRARPNEDFPALKRCLVVGVRKTHRYVENHKVSDFLVPYTSSGCTALCLYCYLVCNFNKCAYLRLYVNREEMFQRLLRTGRESDRELTFEIGSNSDLVLEDMLTGNLAWTVEAWGREGRGRLTFPTKFARVEPLLALNHRGKTVARVSVNPREVIRDVEKGTAPLAGRVKAANALAGAGYPVGLILAPVILTEGWRERYAALLTELADTLSPRVKDGLILEIIFMTYSYVHRAINAAAFPAAPDLFDPALMTGRGRGKYAYKESVRAQAEAFLREQVGRALPGAEILYVV